MRFVAKLNRKAFIIQPSFMLVARSWSIGRMQKRRKTMKRTLMAAAILAAIGAALPLATARAEAPVTPTITVDMIAQLDRVDQASEFSSQRRWRARRVFVRRGWVARRAIVRPYYVRPARWCPTPIGMVRC